MIPWEREAYLTIFNNQIQEEKEKMQQQHNG